MLAFMPTRQRTMYPTVDAITRLAFARWRLAGLLVNRASWHKRRVIGNAAAHEHLLITLRGYALGLWFGPNVNHCSIAALFRDFIKVNGCVLIFWLGWLAGLWL